MSDNFLRIDAVRGALERSGDLKQTGGIKPELFPSSTPNLIAIKKKN